MHAAEEEAHSSIWCHFTICTLPPMLMKDSRYSLMVHPSRAESAGKQQRQRKRQGQGRRTAEKHVIPREKRNVLMGGMRQFAEYVIHLLDSRRKLDHNHMRGSKT